VVCGGLGAGKTSVLKHLLASSEGKRVGIIINDLGEVSMDFHELMEPGQPFRVTAGEAVTSGCICCTRRESFVKAITDFSQRNDVDHILVEASCVAEPLHVAENFVLMQEVAKLDTLVTVVDAQAAMASYDALYLLSTFRKSARANLLTRYRKATPQSLFSPQIRLLLEQLTFANVILMSKCDQLQEDTTAKLHDTLQRLNTDATVHVCQDGKIPMSLVMNKDAFSMEQAELDFRWFREAGAMDGNVTHCIPISKRCMPIKADESAPCRPIGGISMQPMQGGWTQGGWTRPNFSKK